MRYDIALNNLDQSAPYVRSQVERSEFLVAVTGAGISKPSGLPLVEEQVGGVALRDFFRPELLERDPVRYYEIYREWVIRWRQAAPNPAHYALARRGVWVVTQNVDGLHRDAGTEHLIELHGNLRELVCRVCRRIFGSLLAVEQAGPPRCPQCREVLWPGISLEGQQVRHINRAMDWAGRAQVLFVVGTSLEMDPVRRLPAVAEENGALVVWVNTAAEVILPRLLSFQERTSG
ncbi:MAG: iron dicitrate transport regulator FecR [Alicyclobacillaceae bacterium]|nr:iron dicitrate transport regulator FecR [Alicyclobacillaceae bacterium]